MADQFVIPGLKSSIEELDKFNKKVQETSKTLLETAINADKVASAFKDNGGIKAFNDAMKATKPEIDKVQQAKDKLAKAQSDEAKQLAAINLQIQKQNQENKDLAKSTNENASALDKLNYKIKESTLASKELGAQMVLLELEGKKNTDEYKNLEAQFNSAVETSSKLNKSYRDISKAAGDNRALVGSYSEELESHFDKMTKGFTDLADNLKNGNIVGAFQSARNVVEGFGKGLGTATDGVKDVGNSLKNGVQNLVGYGNETKRAAESERLLQLQNIETNAATKAGNIVKNEAGNAGKIMAIGEETATVATWSLNAAIGVLILPITLIVAAIALLTAGLKELDPLMDTLAQYWAGLTGALSKASSMLVELVTDFDKLGNALVHPIDAITSFGEKMGKAADNAMKLKDAEQQLGDLKDIYEVRNKNIESQIKLDEIRLKNKHLSAEEEKKIESDIEANYAKISNNKREINKKEVDQALNEAQSYAMNISNLERKRLNETIRNGDLAYANQLLNDGKIRTSEYEKLKEKVNLVADTNNQLAEDQSRTQAKIQKAEDRTEAERDKIAKNREAAQKKEEDSRKKSFDLLINSKKTTLDFIISSYKQEEHLDDENLNHVKSISLQKQEIAKLEMQKNLVGVQKGSLDYKNIVQKSSEDIQKIKKEESDALDKIEVDKAKFAIELYDYKNETLIKDGATLTDLLVAQEKDRLQKELELNIAYQQKLSGIDKDRLDEKLKSGAQLTKAELTYLTAVKSLEDKFTKDSKTLDKNLLDSKLKANDDEEKAQISKFKLFTKNTTAQNIFELKAEETKLKKDRELQQSNSKEVVKIDLALAENKQKLDKIVAEEKRKTLDMTFQLLTDFAGKDSELTKALTVAKITMDTIDKATAAFETASVLAADPLTAALAPNAYLQAGIITATGAANAAQASGIKFFAKGTMNAPSGVHIVDELGPELHFDKFGNLKSLGSDSGAHLQKLDAGDIIVPHDISEIIKKTMFKSYGMTKEQIDYSKIGDEFGKHANKIVNAVKGKKEAQMSVIVSRNIQDRVSFRGRKV